VLAVRSPGLLSTIQDGGRAGYGHLGVPVSGACDPWGLAVANLLLASPPDAPALEVTLVGPELVARDDCAVALGGADLGAHVPEEGRALHPGGSYRLRAGSTLRFGEPRVGVRAYLALAGGVAADVVLGSASTYLTARLGGIDGRALVPGDILRAARPAGHDAVGRVWPASVPLRPGLDQDPRAVRVVAGPHHGLSGGAMYERLCTGEWHVHPRSDRMGLRLSGPSLTDGGSGARGPAPEGLVSQGMVWGAIQVPPEGGPIVLLADHQTVGGYPVVAVVITADRPVIGQLGPGDRCVFRPVTMEEARRAWLERTEQLRQAAAVLGPDGRERPRERGPGAPTR
jgi:antagonist of KipI